MLPVEIILRRLAFIKYLYAVAVEQSQKPEPLSASSVLTFHDAVELFLQLACEHLDVGKSEVKFMEYWEILRPKLGDGELTQKESMRRLNGARVGLKHHGTRPSKFDMEAFRASATNFFEENTPTIFSTEFSEVSLVELVQSEDARNSLRETQRLLNEDNIEDALGKVAIAFSQIVGDYERRAHTHFGRSPFIFGESMDWLDSFGIGIASGQQGIPLIDSNVEWRLAQFVDKTVESIKALRGAVRIMSLGIDYRKYMRFSIFTPSVSLNAGEYAVSKMNKSSKALASKETVQFCISFVIETAVTLQESDFGFERY